MRVVLDGQVTGADGIARCTRHLAAALTRRAPEAGLSLYVAPPTTTARYSLGEGRRLLEHARRHRADLLHLLDYRIPLGAAVPLVATVHDLLRLRQPQHCYSDTQFTGRFGAPGLAALREATRELRRSTPWPPGARRDPRSWHEEFYGRMTAHTAARAQVVITPTRTVADHLRQAVAHPLPVTVIPWGIDHLPAPDGSPPDGLPAHGYLLYAGQARTHKGLPILLDAFRRSRACRRGIRLVLVGRDFTPSFAADHALDEKITVLGEISDGALTALYRGAAALVHLAAHEGFGFTPLEALSQGTRVLAADLPVLRETLGDHAHFTDPTDPRTAAADLDRLLDTTDSEQHRHTRAAWAHRFRWDTCAAAHLDSYRKAFT